MELKEHAHLMALDVCVRALIATHPDPTEVRRLLGLARADLMESMEDVHRELDGSEQLAQLSLAVDRKLYVLTMGAMGEPPAGH